MVLSHPPHKATYWHTLCRTSDFKVHRRSHGLGAIILISWDLQFTKGVIFYTEGILTCLKTGIRHYFSLERNPGSKQTKSWSAVKRKKKVLKKKNSPSGYSIPYFHFSLKNWYPYLQIQVLKKAYIINILQT